MKWLRQYMRMEDSTLAPYAMKASLSRGRCYPEKEHAIRTIYQRDRDRVIYSTAFRRLQYKTQVFVNHEGDHFRTRLTHTLETNQIARTIARALRLNEDLTEAISLAHDLGHGPFGHAGEWALQEMMKSHGGFEHNRQGLRVVELLEERYAGFRGLNLAYETLEGLKKHAERVSSRRGEKRFRTLEADVVDLADEIAYSSHDLDDGLRSGLITEDQVSELGIWKSVSRKARGEALAGAGKQKEAYVRLIINRFVMDVVENSLGELKKMKVKSVEDLQGAGRKIVGFSAPVKREHSELKKFLYRNLYQHHYVLRMTGKGQRFVKMLFLAYLENPKLLPPEILSRGEQQGKRRAICDYLAGMTDRFAVDEYLKLFEPYEKMV